MIKNQERCSVLVVSDILEMARFAGHGSEAEIGKTEEEAPKKGIVLTKDYLVNYAVQPLTSGQS